MTRYEDARDDLFEQKIDLFLIEWLESWIVKGGKEETFVREVLRRVNRANQIRKSKIPIEALGTRLPTFVDVDESQDSAGQALDADGQNTLSHRILNERGLGKSADGPAHCCPAQPNSMGQASGSESQNITAHRTSNGLGQNGVANGRNPSSKPVTHREPTQGQIDAVIRATQAGAKTLFDRMWCAKPLGDHSWYSLSAINRESRAFLDALGPIPEEDKHRSLRELFCHDEDRVRRAMRSAGMRTNKAA